MKWQPMKTAPRNGTHILAGWKMSKERVIVRYEMGCWQTVPGNWVKHPNVWQPLPEPPQ